MTIRDSFLHRSDVPRRQRFRWYLLAVNLVALALSAVPVWVAIDSF